MSALDTRESTTSAGWKIWWLPLCVLVPLSPWIAVYLRQIWRIESLRFFPLLFVLVGYLLAKRYTPSGSGLSQKLGYTIGAAGCTIAIGGALLNSPWLVWVGTVCMLAIVAGQWRHRVDAHAAWPLWGLLWLTVRMPGDFSQRFMQKLQSISTRASSVLLDFLGVMHYRAGNVIEVPGQRFMVEEACSGVQSLYSLIFVAISLAVLYRRSFAQAIVLSVAAAFWACVMNVLRILTVILGREWFEQDWISGWQHDLVGYIALAVAIGLLFSTDRLLFLLSGPVMENDGDVQTGRNVNPLILFYNRVIGGGVGPWYEQKRSPFEASEVATTLPSKASWIPTLACSCLIGGVGAPHLWTMNNLEPIIPC